jgi:two-component system, NarL family, response regulator LiaR
LTKAAQDSPVRRVLVDVFANRRQSIRILLVEDDPGFRELLAFVLRVDTEAEIVGQACDGAEGVRLAQALEPDVVLMDLQMPKLDGFEATRRIAAKVPRAEILVISSTTEDGDVARALEAGAAGFLPKDRAVAELPQLLGELRPASPQVRRAWQMPLLRPSQMTQNA